MFCVACRTQQPLHAFDAEVSVHVCVNCTWSRSQHVWIMEGDGAVDWWIIAAEANGWENPVRRFAWEVR